MFLVSGPPDFGARRHSQERRSFYHYPRGSVTDSYEQGSDWLSVATTLSKIILSTFIISIFIQVLVRFVAFLFSPPVLLLCICTLVVNQGWHKQALATLDQYFPKEFCLFRNFCSGMGRSCRNNFGSEAAATGGEHAKRSTFGSLRPATKVLRRQSNDRQEVKSEQRKRAPEPTTLATLANPDTVLATYIQDAIAAIENRSNDSANSKSDEPEEGGRAKNDSANLKSTDPEKEGRSKNDSRSHYSKVPLHHKETDKALTIAMDISGFDVSKLKITVENSFLRFRGERKNKIGDKFILEERFELDEELYDVESVAAHAADGILEVHVSKKEAPMPRVVPIKTELSVKTD